MEFSIAFVFVLMLLLHMVADYTLQGWLANGKCKSWWEQNAPDEKYRKDYKCALLCHAFYWAAVTFLPILLIDGCCVVSQWKYILALALNTPVHYFVDDLKANRGRINLWEDQVLHFLQIGITAILVWLL